LDFSLPPPQADFITRKIARIPFNQAMLILALSTIVLSVFVMTISPLPPEGPNAPKFPPPKPASSQNGAEGGGVKSGWEEATRLGIETARDGDHQTARGYFKVAYDLNPESSISAMNYGVALMRSNMLDEAMEMMEISNKLDVNGENKELADNFRAIGEHLDYRDKKRSGETIRKGNEKMRARSRS